MIQGFKRLQTFHYGQDLRENKENIKQSLS